MKKLGGQTGEFRNIRSSFHSTFGIKCPKSDRWWLYKKLRDRIWSLLRFGPVFFRLLIAPHSVTPFSCRGPVLWGAMAFDAPPPPPGYPAPTPGGRHTLAMKGRIDGIHVQNQLGFNMKS